MTDREQEVAREILISGAEQEQQQEEEEDGENRLSAAKDGSREARLVERLRWLRARARLLLRRLTCSCGTWTRGRGRGAEEGGVRVEQREGAGEGAGEVEDIEAKSLITVHSYEVDPKQEAELRGVTRSGYERVVTDLENLEKVILRDSLKETVRRQRGMETISEEVELAFSNLSYDAVTFGRGEAEHSYENVETRPREDTQQHVYENVQSQDQVYENISHENSARKVKAKESILEEYESYDFGENGIYQNIVFSKGNTSVPGSDISLKVDALQKCINEVNDIIKPKSPEAETVNEAKKPINILQMPIQQMPDCQKKATNSNAMRTKSITSNFRSWALGATEPPKIDLNKLNKTSSSPGVFTQEEKNVVSDFLKSVRSELKL